MADTLIREGTSFQSQPLAPVPQYWNASTSTYEKVQGVNGASRVLLYDASGNPLLTDANPGKVGIVGALPAGDNNIGNVDVLSLPELPAGTNNIGDIDVVSMPDVVVASVPVAGAHANAWNADAVLADGTSAVIDCQYQRTVSAFGNADAATTIKVQVSQDGTNFYDSGSEATLAGAGDFHIVLDTGVRYVRLHSSAAATITATVAGK